MTVMGIDVGNSNDTYRITYQIAKPRTMSESQSAKESSEILTLEDRSLFGSRSLANSTLSRKINFVQTKVLVISERLARQKYALEYVESLIRDREFRRDIFLITSRGTAESFIKYNKTQLEKNTYKMYELIVQTGKTTGLIPFTQLQEFLVETQNLNSVALTIYGGVRKSQTFKSHSSEDQTKAGDLSTHTKNPIQFLGSAVFSNQKMIGTLNGSETKQALMIRGDVTSVDESFLVPGEKNKYFSLRMRQQRKPKTLIDISHRPYRIQVTIPLDSDVTEVPGETNFVRSDQGITELEKRANEQMNKKTHHLIQKSQQQLGVDFFGFNKLVRMQCWTIPEYENTEWKKEYPKAKVTVTYDIHIRRTGRELGPVEREV